MRLFDARDYQPWCYGRVEAALIRVAFVFVVWWSLPSATDMAALVEQKYPTGLASLVDLTWLSEPGVFFTCKILLGVASAVYIAHWLMPLATGLMTLIHVSVFTLDNSQGATNHAYQLISLVLLAQFFTYLSPHVIRVIERWRKVKFKPLFTVPGLTWRDLALYYSLQAIGAAYVIAGVTKLIRSKGMWAWQTPNLSVELLKTNAQNYYNNLSTDAVYDQRLQVASWMIEHPHLTRILMGGGLAIELFAFLALRSRLWALITGLALLALHGGIKISMGLFFKFNIAVIIVFLINPAYWIGRLFPAGAKAVTPPPPRDLGADSPAS